MTNTQQPEPFDIDSVPVAFNMDLANGPTTVRFCYAAAELLGQDISAGDLAYLQDEDAGQEHYEINVDYSNRLGDAGYYAHWDMGDVVVYDLRNLSDDEREAFYSETETW